MEERISEIPDANTQTVFADQIIGSQPQDLKAIIQIEEEVAPPHNAGLVEVLPIVQKIEDIKTNIEENIATEFKDKPEELKNTDFFDNPILSKTPDVVDIQVAQAVVTALESSPEVQPEVITVAKQEETKIIDTFVENISKMEGQTNVTEIAAESLNPVPEALATLIDLKEQLPPSEQIKIDIAIKAEVVLIEDHLVNHVTDAATIETYVAQIMQDPVVVAVIEQVGGQTLLQTIEAKVQTVEQQSTQEQSQLATTVEQIQQEVLSAPLSSPSTVEQSLPQPIKEEIQQIKQEVPAAQIPSVTVAIETSISTTVEAQPVDTTPVVAPVVEQPQASQPVPQAETPSAPQPAAPQESAPAPAAPQTQSAPEQPAVPGL